MAPLSNEPSSKGVDAVRAMGFVWDILLSIAVPTTLLALGGRWLDQRWHTNPWFVLIGLFLSLLIAGALVMHQAKRFKL